MDFSIFRRCWFLTGPTASGKSAAAIAISQTFGAEIVALDSMTLYRGIDIGSAKPSPSERALVPHHLIDVLDPWESASVDWYVRQTAPICEAIFARGRQPLFVGGTPLYLKAALRGLFDGPGEDAELRRALGAEAAELGTAALHARLEQIDPVSARRIHRNDLRRIVRALEIHQLTGRPISSFQETFDRPANPPARVACIRRDKEDLHRRINNRVRAMFDAGWIDEVQRLASSPRPLSRQASQAVGIAEILELLAGKRGFDETAELIQLRTRQFAKRQMTWFRHIEECRMIDVAALEHDADVSKRLVEFFKLAPSLLL